MEHAKRIAIEEIAAQAQAGDDISEHFTRQYVAKQNVTLDFPLALLRLIDAECQKLGITRQVWIRMACEERLQKMSLNGSAKVLALSATPPGI